MKFGEIPQSGLEKILFEEIVDRSWTTDKQRWDDKHRMSTKAHLAQVN